MLLETDLSIEFLGTLAEKMLGRAATDVLHKRLFVAYPEIRAASLEKKLAEALETDKVASAEIEISRDGSGERYAIRIVPQRHGSGLSLFFEPASSA